MIIRSNVYCIPLDPHDYTFWCSLYPFGPTWSQILMFTVSLWTHMIIRSNVYCIPLDPHDYTFWCSLYPFGPTWSQILMFTVSLWTHMIIRSNVYCIPLDPHDYTFWCSLYPFGPTWSQILMSTVSLWTHKISRQCESISFVILHRHTYICLNESPETMSSPPESSQDSLSWLIKYFMYMKQTMGTTTATEMAAMMIFPRLIPQSAPSTLFSFWRGWIVLFVSTETTSSRDSCSVTVDCLSLLRSLSIFFKNLFASRPCWEILSRILSVCMIRYCVSGSLKSTSEHTASISESDGIVSLEALKLRVLVFVVVMCSCFTNSER